MVRILRRSFRLPTLHHVLPVLLLERRRVRAAQGPALAAISGGNPAAISGGNLRRQSPDGRGDKRKADVDDPRGGHREDRRRKDRRRIRRLQHELRRAEQALTVLHLRGVGTGTGDGPTGGTGDGPPACTGMSETGSLLAAKSFAAWAAYHTERARREELEREQERDRDRLSESEERQRMQRCQSRHIRAALSNALAAARSELEITRSGSRCHLVAGAGVLTDGSLAEVASQELDEARSRCYGLMVEVVVERDRSADLQFALDRALGELHIRRCQSWEGADRAACGEGLHPCFDAALAILASPEARPDAVDPTGPIDCSLLTAMLDRMRPRHIREAEALIRMRASEGMTGVGGEAALAVAEAERPGSIAAATARELETIMAERAANGEEGGSAGPPPVDPAVLAAMMVRLRPVHELEATRTLWHRGDLGDEESTGDEDEESTGVPDVPDVPVKARQGGRGCGGGPARGGRGSAGVRDGVLRRSTRLSSQNI